MSPGALPKEIFGSNNHFIKKSAKIEHFFRLSESFRMIKNSMIKKSLHGGAIGLERALERALVVRCFGKRL
jgi:hypothetical protein